MANKRNLLLPLAAALTLISCGGGGGGGGNDSGQNTDTATRSGKAVDGYLSGATVFCDSNANGVQNDGEMAVTTDSGGNFRFPSLCASSIVVKGGTDMTTNYRFAGTLKASPGSSVVTPLTSLLSAGLSKAQLVKALGLPETTDIANLDPLAPGNGALYRKTLAAQQIVQQLANVLGTQASPDSLDELYTHVAGALAAAIQASPNTPLFSPAGEVDVALVTAAISGAITRINADPALPNVALSGQDIADVRTALETQTEKFLKAPEGNLDDVAKEQQNPLKEPIQTDTVKKDYIFPADDAVTINGDPYLLGDFSSDDGIEVEGLDTIGLTYGASDSNPAINTVVDVAASLDAVADDDKRVLQVKVERVRVQRSNSGADAGKVILSVTPDTIVTVYVSDRNGSTFNASINGSTFNPLTIVNNNVVVDYAELVQRTVGNGRNTGPFDASQFTDITGTFTVKFVVSPNLNVRRGTSSSSVPLPTLNIGIFNTDKGVTGPGIQGTLTILPVN